jgi:16S rRNA (guanine(966)-N(2))-methyltransferase RsmD
VANLRVTAGALRGRRILVPAGDLRPTSERARQAFFNILGKRVDGARFLDLFAGSGIFSFEAISRGAASATAVDHDRRKVEAISRLAKEWNVPLDAVQGEVVTTLARLGRAAYDIVYADPPYDYEGYDVLLDGISGHVSLAPRAVVAVEHRKRTNPFTKERERLQFQRRAEYGEVWITFFKALGDGRRTSALLPAPEA